MTISWEQVVQRHVDDADVQQLMSEGMSSVLARVYAARGVRRTAQLTHDLSGMLHFNTLLQIDDMAARLADAVTCQLNVVVVADYDADGATACAVAVRGLALMGLTVQFFVPNRFIHGYGLTPEVVGIVAQQQPAIIITVDNGIASVDGVEAARQLGIEVLVTDHHLPGEHLPQAIIVNPNQLNCTFSSKHLAGVGVMFYVLLATRAHLQTRGYFVNRALPNMAQLLDLVALGTVADVVKLDENNRILVEQGLRRMRQGHACAGITALFAVAGRAMERATAIDLGFMIGPRLNAAGRLEDMSLGIHCLLTDDQQHAAEMAQRLHELNAERREIEGDMQEQALAAMPDLHCVTSSSVVLFDEVWHAGVIGILASRLKDRYHRPTICFARGQAGEIKGSGRSISGLHLRDALDWVTKQRPGLIHRFGGHAAAAGLSLEESRFKEFVHWFELAAQRMLTEYDLQRVIQTDGVLDEQDLSVDLAQSIHQQVWGQGFPMPCFAGEWRVVQQRVLKERHLKLKLAHGKQDLDAILFNYAQPMPEFIRGVYQLDLNTYNGNTRMQLRLQDWCAA